MTISWTNGKADALVVVLTTQCSDVGSWSVNDAFTQAILPAGYASQCQGPVALQFDAVGINVGTGYGTFTGSSDSSVQFSYGATLNHAIPNYQEMRRRALIDYRSGLRKINLNMH